MTPVKICGITRPEDAKAAAALGAAAIGLVFWPPSPRAVSIEQARIIAAAVAPFTSVVGVFVNETVEQINRVAASVPLDVIQLHGDEEPGDRAGLHRRVIKALSVDGLSNARAWTAEVTLLVDAVEPLRRGGTGTTVDWARVAPVARARRVILAGGLRPENVAAAIRAVRPYGIDVSSGVEAAPGVKDAARLRALFSAVREADGRGRDW